MISYNDHKMSKQNQTCKQTKIKKISIQKQTKTYVLMRVMGLNERKEIRAKNSKVYTLLPCLRSNHLMLFDKNV